MANAQRLDRVGQVSGACRPVQQHGQFTSQVQAEENHVGRYRAGQQHADRVQAPLSFGERGRG